MSKILTELFVGNIYQVNSLFDSCMDLSLAFDGLHSQGSAVTYPTIKAVITVCFDQPLWCSFCRRRDDLKRSESSTDHRDHPSLPQELLKYKNDEYVNLHIDQVANLEGESQNVIHSIIFAGDSHDETLFNAFEFAYDLIEHVARSGGATFIHCMAGMSRSVTMAASYLIKKWNKDFNHVYKYILSVHPKAAISNEFAYQLRLYKRYRYIVDRGFASYYFNTYNFDEDYLMMEDEQEFEDFDSKFVYSCKTCREVLFFDTNVISHQRARDSDPECSSIFIEPMDWMPGLESQDGRLLCKNAKCNSKLGYYSWHGRRCSCSYLQVPAFQIQSSKIDVFCRDPRIHRYGPVRNVDLA